MRDSELEQYEFVDVEMDKEKIVVIVMPDLDARCPDARQSIHRTVFACALVISAAQSGRRPQL